MRGAGSFNISVSLFIFIYTVCLGPEKEGSGHHAFVTSIRKVGLDTHDG